MPAILTGRSRDLIQLGRRLNLEKMFHYMVETFFLFAYHCGLFGLYDLHSNGMGTKTHDIECYEADDLGMMVFCGMMVKTKILYIVQMDRRQLPFPGVDWCWSAYLQRITWPLS